MAKPKLYVPEIEAFIRENSSKLSNSELAQIGTQKFGVNLTARGLQAWKKKNHIPSLRKYDNLNGYEDWELDLIAWFCPSMTDKELSDWFLLVWNRERSSAGIKSVRFKYKITNGRTGLWKDVSHERSEKWSFLFSRHNNRPSTCFKKGQKPVNTMEMGAERLNSDGYYEIKTDCKRGWQYRSRLVYEKAHGPIPKGYCVIHIDGNKANDNLENLMLVSKEERLQAVVKIKLIEGESDFNRAVLNLAKLQCREAEYGREN